MAANRLAFIVQSWLPTSNVRSIALLATAIFLAANFASASMLRKATVQTYFVQGDVQVTIAQSGETRTLSRGELLAQGDRVETTRASSAMLLFSNGSTINLMPESRLTISTFQQEPFMMTERNFAQMLEDPSPSTTILQVRYGKIIGRMKNLHSGSVYTVTSPAGSAHIRGATFVFSTLTKSEAQLVDRQSLSIANASLAVNEGSADLSVGEQILAVADGESVTVRVTLDDGATGSPAVLAVGATNISDIAAEDQALITEAIALSQEAAANAFLVSPGGEPDVKALPPMPLQNDPPNLNKPSSVDPVISRVIGPS